MKDETKDFRYYADKAEQLLTKRNVTAQDADWAIARAEVYAHLAAAAPKPEPAYVPMYDND